MESEDRQRILAALRDGEKIRAIKLYRQQTGCGLKEAKDFIEQLQAALDSGEVPKPLGEIARDESVESQILELMRRGEKIPAIKVHREAFGSSLKDAKTAVEKLAAEQGIESAATGCAGVVIMFVGVLGAVAVVVSLIA